MLSTLSWRCNISNHSAFKNLLTWQILVLTFYLFSDTLFFLVCSLKIIFVIKVEKKQPPSHITNHRFLALSLIWTFMSYFCLNDSFSFHPIVCGRSKALIYVQHMEDGTRHVRWHQPPNCNVPHCYYPQVKRAPLPTPPPPRHIKCML